MAGANLLNILRHVGRLVTSQTAQGTPDQDLLERFLRARDDGAFTALMERHGVMVLGVCQGILRNAHDAEDACQAVFLVLARKAASVRKWGSLGSWLHGVAWRTAHKHLASLRRRSARETTAAALNATVMQPADISYREVLRLLNEELTRLPRIYRDPLVLCHLEGRTQDEAARELGWTAGTLRGRLERGRAKLRSRLARRGVTGAAVLAVGALVPGMAGASLPPTLVVTTANASLTVAAGQAIPAQVPLEVALLARQIWGTSFLTKVAIVGILGVAAILLGLVPLLSKRSAQIENAVLVANLADEIWSEAKRLQGGGLHFWCVAYSPDGKRLATGSGGILPSAGELKVWDAATGQVLFAQKTPRSVRCVAFSPNGKLLATAEHDGVAKLRDAESGNLLSVFQGHSANIDTVAFSFDGKTLATSSWDNSVKLWDVGTGKQFRTLRGHTGQVFAVAFGGADGTLASCGADGTIKLWQSENNQAQFSLRGHKGTVQALAVSPDGKTLASASWDKTVKLWDMTTRNLLATLSGHTDPVLAVAFSPDGKTLASSSGPWGVGERIDPNTSNPGEVILWDLTAHEARAFLPFPDRVFGLAFSQDGKTLAIAGWDGSLSLWNSRPDSNVSGPRPSNPVNNSDLKFSLAIRLNGEKKGPDLKKDYGKVFQNSFKGGSEAAAGFLIYGPDTQDCVKFEPEGLRLVMPAGYPRPRPGTGLATDFGVRGDFEITVSYEILAEIEPKASKPCELSLIIVPYEPAKSQIWHKANQNRAALARQSASQANDQQFLASLAKWNEATVTDKWGNEKFDNKETFSNLEIPAQAKTGRLRLVRNGTTLYYLAAEGQRQEFTLLHKEEFGAKDLKNVRILATTPGPAAIFDVRLTDFIIRADELPKDLTAVMQPSSGSGWLAISLVLLLSGTALPGIWLYLRKRPGAASVLQKANVLTFHCGSCGKRLKTRTELAGKKVKCPGCGLAVEVPKESP
jgi:RNA polymerase sigma factor (sigma-70 family)